MVISVKKGTELKRCPFCGGKAEFYKTPVKIINSWCDGVAVRCKECGARTNWVLYNKEKHGVDGEYDEAAAAWNVRKPVEKVAEGLKEEEISFTIIYRQAIKNVKNFLISK